MMDEYHARIEREAFEAAFDAKFSKPRFGPKTFKPTPKDQIPTPWYLNPDSDGPQEKGLTD